MKRSLFAVAIAMVLALVGCAMLWIYVNAADARVMAGKEATRVLVAKKRIPAGKTGAEINSGDYTEQVSMPKSAVPDDALTTIDQSLAELVLTADLQPRQLLMKGAFGTATVVNNGLRIPEGKSAITVPIIKESGTGFLQPGAKVALYNTFTSRATLSGTVTDIPAGNRQAYGEGVDHVTRLLLPSVEVVAVATPTDGVVTNSTESKSAETKASDGKDKSSDSSATTLVTFAVDQAEAERLIHAAQTGTLYLALPGDATTLQAGPGVDDFTLFK
jgi:pilus assembly protein CpaB